MLRLPCSSSTLEQRSSTCIGFYSCKMSLFILHCSYSQSSNRHDKSCCLYTFAVISNHPPMRDLLLGPMFSCSFIDFEKVFKLPVIASKEGSSLGMFGIKVLSWGLCSKYWDFKWKIISSLLTTFWFFTLRTKITPLGANSLNSLASFSVETLSKPSLC